MYHSQSQSGVIYALGHSPIRSQLWSHIQVRMMSLQTGV